MVIHSQSRNSTQQHKNTCKSYIHVRKPAITDTTVNTILTVKHEGLSVMTWSCICAKGVGEVTFANAPQMPVDTQHYRSPELGRRRTFQHDNNPKHTFKITQEFLNKKQNDLCKTTLPTMTS
uniref:Uncharacterized protein n=1 Tax=Amphiprion ocellaris TaxID=80972 RepID=A0AAQ5ZTC4_AMPOC